MSFPSMLVIIITSLLFVLSHISFAIDTITQSTSFLDGSTLVSKDGSFELGFFGNSSNRYIGIWYKNIPVRRVVWVANRDNPTKDNSSKLIINRDGNLLLLNHNESLVWSINATKKISSPVFLQLLDNGNFVLRYKNSNSNSNSNSESNLGGEENFLWQSFDYPCDTILSEMKFGWNKKTGFEKRLAAWRTADDPSSGNLTITMMHTSNPETIIWKGSTKYYRSGPWNAQTSGVVGLKTNPLYNFEFINNEDEAYYMYTLKNKSVVSIMVINQTLSSRQRLIWVPESKTWSIYQSLPLDGCDVYNICGPNGHCIIDGSPMCQCLDGFKPKSYERWNAMNWTQGCVQSGNWSCGVKNQDGFHKFVGMKFPDTTNSWINLNMTLDNCKMKCLQNCSCTAYTYLDPTGKVSGCSLWFDDLLDLRLSQSSGQDLYVRTDTSSEIDAKHGQRKNVILAVSIPISIALLMLLALSYIYITKVKHKGKNLKDGNEDFELPLFDVSTMLKATNNFSFNNKLGEGGFGPVYKGTLIDGQIIAVKRLSGKSEQGLIEFKNEVILCAKLQHRNLVKVIGCCIEGEEKILLYEYMPKRSLDLFIFDSVQSKLLNWSMRFNILNGIARGLQYLHQDSRLRIIHRDLKASNILLDNEMNPKISDFGLAKMFGGDQIEGKTRRIIGTYGYMAPEYVIHGLFSIKSDVFSFGVLLLEIISGKKNRSLTYHEHDHNLLWHVSLTLNNSFAFINILNNNSVKFLKAWRLWREGVPHELIDNCLKDTCVQHEALRCIQIGLLCVQHIPDYRPNMPHVIMMLGGESTLPQPKEPGFLIEMISIEEQSFSERQASSVNEVTLSIISSR
ncbi:G-type lectin S-receptor-like serine/threonine-protein kinase At4g27290 isoform X2 [Vicia villosa]|uniref:G-type lectin S-receptor-like serine/threonine-protein kinase At4g27290 isoform X2 n=1 Tax=Vicia villosa TaxID=3911 RepID=UPI00273AFA53|nr:G-type lectin S-receptor-like serine/threonine-protein kinase At4g27290 isoform X2 [Vicia villosa]